MTKPVGAYRPIVRAGDWLVASGQVGIFEGELVSGGFHGQLNQALDNLEALLQGEGATLADVVKTTVFLTDMALFAEMNAVYAEVLGDARPARSTVAVRGLPRGAMVEIELVAARPR